MIVSNCTDSQLRFQLGQPNPKALFLALNTLNGELSLPIPHSPAGHGNSSSLKTPTRVDTIGPVRQVACGAAHTLALAMDGLTVYSFGSGDSGKLGHGDTNRQTTPKVGERARRFLWGES